MDPFIAFDPGGKTGDCACPHQPTMVVPPSSVLGCRMDQEWTETIVDVHVTILFDVLNLTVNGIMMLHGVPSESIRGWPERGGIKPEGKIAHSLPNHLDLLPHSTPVILQASGRTAIPRFFRFPNSAPNS